MLGEYSIKDVHEQDDLLPERVVLAAQSLRVREIIPPHPVQGHLVIPTPASH